MVSSWVLTFRMGLFLFVPMLLIDLLVAVILMSLGMMMVRRPWWRCASSWGLLLAGGWHLWSLAD